MNFTTLAIILAVLIGLKFLRLPTICWLAIWPVAVWCFVRLGISPPVPQSVLNIYLGLTVLGAVAYIFADTARSAEVLGQITRFIVEPRYKLALMAVGILLPLLAAGKVYNDLTLEVRALTFGRTIHPAPPGEVNFKGKSINLISGKNPFRELETKEPAKFREHVEAGRKVYYQNCFYCHGDDMNGDGMFAHGLSPVPANFNSPTTIAMLQEGYLFWRIAKGGPGLPEESGPWSSSMPAWEKFLEEEDIWNVILFLYDYTGFKPRAEEEGHH